MKRIPLFKVHVAPTAAKLVSEVLASGYIGQGPKVDEFEVMLTLAFDSARPVLAVNSCTSAIELSLHMCGVGPGDEVITTPQTCTATNSPIIARGARPVWADIWADSGNISSADIARKITSRTKAIICVDWAGVPCDYAAIRAVAKGIPIIEDAAHATLARYDGQSIANTGGDYVCWSFQAIKHLTTGDGGALVVPKGMEQRAKLLRWYGLDRESSASFRCSQNISEIGYKFQMNDIAAAIGIANLPRLEFVVERCRENASWYADNLPRWAQGKDMSFVLPLKNNDASWWLYTIHAMDGRDEFITFMGDRGIDCSLVHNRNDNHDALNYPNGKLPGVEAFSRTQVSIPCGWWVTKEDRNRVREAMLEWTNK